MPEASSKETGSETGLRLAALRAELARRGLDGFVVPHADEHQGEYVAPASERLAWLPGFTGSAGAAVVLAERAAAFAAGRCPLPVRGPGDHVRGGAYRFFYRVPVLDQ